MMNIDDLEDTSSHYSDKNSVNPATIFDAADDERAFLKQFSAEKHRQVAKVFWEPITMFGMFTPQGLMDYLREHVTPWQQDFWADRYTDSEKSFQDQLLQAIHRDPMAVAYAAYLLEYAAHRMLPHLLSVYAVIEQELPPTKAQQVEFEGLGIGGLRGYNRRTVEVRIAQQKAEYARQSAEFLSRKAKKLEAYMRQVRNKNS